MPGGAMTRDEAWAEAERLNMELGARGEKQRYAIAVAQEDGSWAVDVTDEPQRSFFKSLVEGVFGNAVPPAS
jgi:nitrogen fixation protein FixH